MLSHVFSLSLCIILFPSARWRGFVWPRLKRELWSLNSRNRARPKCWRCMSVTALGVLVIVSKTLPYVEFELFFLVSDFKMIQITIETCLLILPPELSRTFWGLTKRICLSWNSYILQFMLFGREGGFSFWNLGNPSKIYDGMVIGSHMLRKNSVCP